MVRLILILASTALIGACATRPVSKIETDRSIDNRLTCEHIIGEYVNNTRRLEELALEMDHVDRNNSSAVLGGVGGLTTIDDLDAQRSESSKLAARNERLISLYADRGCSGSLGPQITVQVH